MSTNGESFPIEVPLVYSGSIDEPIPLLNHFSMAVSGPEFFLILGQVSPPPLVGSPEQQFVQARQLAHVTVKILGRYALSFERAVELRALLDNQIEGELQRRQESKTS